MQEFIMTSVNFHIALLFFRRTRQVCWVGKERAWTLPSGGAFFAIKCPSNYLAANQGCHTIKKLPLQGNLQKK